MTTYEKLRERALAWGHSRCILSEGTLAGQAMKNLEEAQELLEGVRDNDQEAIVDALGDNLVTLLMCAEMAGYDLLDCLERALVIIEGRSGCMVNGVFVKEAPNV